MGGWEALPCESWTFIQIGCLLYGDFSNDWSEFDEGFRCATQRVKRPHIPTISMHAPKWSLSQTGLSDEMPLATKTKISRDFLISKAPVQPKKNGALRSRFLTKKTKKADLRKVGSRDSNRSNTPNTRPPTLLTIASGRQGFQRSRQIKFTVIRVLPVNK